MRDGGPGSFWIADEGVPKGRDLYSVFLVRRIVVHHFAARRVEGSIRIHGICGWRSRVDFYFHFSIETKPFMHVLLLIQHTSTEVTV